MRTGGVSAAVGQLLRAAVANGPTHGPRIEAALEQLLAQLALGREAQEEPGERGETIWYFGGPDVSFGLRQAQAENGVDRYRVGLHHLALDAFSRGVVDERHDWLRSVGAEIESPPQEYTYMPGYYAVFFYDPDGLKLEIVHVPPRAA